MNEFKLIILNPDSTNNFANFETESLIFYSNGKTDPIQISTGTNPDVYSDTWPFPPDRSINLIQYFKGNLQSYNIFLKARRVTTKQLNCKISIKFNVQEID